MGRISSGEGAGMRASIAVSALVALVCLAGASATQEHVVELDDGGVVQPIAAVQESESRSAASKAMNALRKRVQGATSLKQVKTAMKKTIRGAVIRKKAQLLQKAEDEMKNAAQKEGKKIVKRKNASYVKRKMAKIKAKVSDDALNQKAKEQAAKAKLAKAKAKRMRAERKVRRLDAKKSLVFSRKSAEEKAKTATADRVAAEERAKAAAANKLTAEEVAKRSAALKIAAREQAQAAQKSPLELKSMEAHAYQQAAELKTKEAQALAGLAALKSGQDSTKQLDRAVASEAKDGTRLSRAKAKLQSLMTSANRSLRKAEASPFSKSALKSIVKKRQQVKAAKAEVVRLAAQVSSDKAAVKRDRKKPKTRSARKIAKKAVRRAKAIAGKGKKYDLKHPNLKHMTKKQIKYWANKRMKWRSESPMKKTKVMAKIFGVKNMEAKTLEKMNELNVRIGMKSKGVRAAMLRKGRTAIVNGELIKPKAKFHVKQTFQGRKGRDPKLSPPTRDPRTDRLKKLTNKHLKNRLLAVSKATDRQIKVAMSLRKDTGKPVGQKSVTRVKDLKKAVKQNKKAGLSTKGGTELGDDDDDIAAQDEADADAAIQQGDDDAMMDDNAVSMAMDDTDVENDIASIN